MTSPQVIILEHLLNLIDFVAGLICFTHSADMKPVSRISGKTGARIYERYLLCYMAQTIHIWISQMYYTLFGGFG